MSSYYTSGGSTPEESAQPSTNRTTIQRNTNRVSSSSADTDNTDTSGDPRSVLNPNNFSKKIVSTNTTESDRTAQYKYSITLSYTVKTEYQDRRWEPQVPAAGSAFNCSVSIGNIDGETSYSPVGALPPSEAPEKDGGDGTVGYKPKTIEWTIGSNNPIDYGYHLDESPWVRDNGDLHLLNVGGDAVPGSETNSWYESFDVNQTCINPDFGKMPSESVGQISLTPSDMEGFVIQDPGQLHWTYETDFTHRCITPSRGYGESAYDPSEDSPALLVAPSVSKENRLRSSVTFGDGDFSQNYIYPIPFDERGMLRSTSAIEAFNFYPRGDFFDIDNLPNGFDKERDSAAALLGGSVTRDVVGEDYYWMAAWMGVYSTKSGDPNSPNSNLTFESTEGYDYTSPGYEKTRAPYWSEET